MEHIHKKIDEGMLVVGIYFDFSKAFDSIDPKCVEDKLYAIGIRGVPLKLVISFLSGRKLFVSANGASSREYPLEYGVAQGSILGPLIFLLYINDLHENVKAGIVINYADDVSLAVSACAQDELESRINKVTREMEQWCNQNKLLLNNSKTVYVNFSASRRARLTFGGFTISNCVRFLGLMTDCDLRYDSHVDSVIKKLNKAFYVILKMKNKMDTDALMNIYYALAYPYLAYGVVTWGGAITAANMQRLLVAQKRLLRVIFGLRNTDTCRPLFKGRGILTFPGIYIYKCCIYMFENRRKYQLNGDSHEYRTRGRDNVRIPAHSTAMYEKGPGFSCITIYRHLPKYISECVSVGQFKRYLKQHLVSACHYELKDYYSDF